MLGKEWALAGEVDGATVMVAKAKSKKPDSQGAGSLSEGPTPALGMKPGGGKKGGGYNRGHNPGGGGGDKKDDKCRYCFKPGHFRKECRKKTTHMKKGINRENIYAPVNINENKRGEN